MTPGTFVVLNLLGGVALLLWGVRMVRTGITRAWGDRLKRFIEVRLRNRLSAFAAGAAATALLSSGTAMTLIVAGIAASGTIGTAMGLAVLLGADVGSAAVSALFTSGSSQAIWLSPVLLFIGYAIFTTSREFRPHNVGRILIGLGLMLLALKLVITATAPLREATLFHDVLGAIGREPVLAFLAGAVLAWLCHSTLAVILLIASFLANGSLDLAAALAVILGVNFGGGLPAVTASLTLSPEARRLPAANLFCRGFAAIASLSVIRHVAPGVMMLPLGPIETAVAFHTAFNLAAGLFFLPFTGPVAALMRKLVPDLEATPDHLSEPRYLDRMALETPSVALSNAALETARMGELVDRMFETALTALRLKSLETIKLVRPLDERLNHYQASVQAYLADLTGMELSTSEARRALEIMLYASNLEHAGDVILLNLADRIKAKAKESLEFSPAQEAALDELSALIRQSLKLATGVLASRNVEGAKRLIAQKDAFRALENRVIGDNFSPGAKTRGNSLRRSALYVDMIRDLHRINSHIVSAGYPIVEEAGLLRESRIRAALTAS